MKNDTQQPKPEQTLIGVVLSEMAVGMAQQMGVKPQDLLESMVYATALLTSNCPAEYRRAAFIAAGELLMSYADPSHPFMQGADTTTH